MRKKRIDKISVTSLKGRSNSVRYLNTKFSLLFHTCDSLSFLVFANRQLEHILLLPFTFTCRIELWKTEKGFAVSSVTKITSQAFKNNFLLSNSLTSFFVSVNQEISFFSTKILCIYFSYKPLRMELQTVQSQVLYKSESYVL